MTESFWYLTGDDVPESDAERPDLSGTLFESRDGYAPFQESMRGDRSRPQRAPSTDQKRIRRQIHRSGELEDKEAAYGEGAQQPIIPTEKLPFISENDARPRSFLEEMLESIHREVGMSPAPRDPGGFDEPFQRDRFKLRQHHQRKRRESQEKPFEDKTPTERGVDLLGDLIGPPDTVRRPGDEVNPNQSTRERKLQHFKDRWNKTFEPVGLTEEGKARSRRNTRKLWQRAMGPPACDHPNCPPWEHHEGGYRPKYSSKTATVLNTQVERLNAGDQIRTPTGQTSQVKKIRPHETDSTLMYLDTDMGTSTVKRGTDFQVIPRNSQQQELPDTGNPVGTGNTAELPGAGRTPGGTGGGGVSTAPSVCPNCGNTGTFHLQGGNFMCSVCGFTVPSGGSPGNLIFTNQPHGYMPARRRPGETPRAHVWASKYITSNESSSQIARRARQVAGGDQ